jgi:hypothetical protein
MQYGRCICMRMAVSQEYFDVLEEKVHSVFIDDTFKLVIRKTWPMAADKEVTPAVHNEFCNTHLGTIYEDDMLPSLEIFYMYTYSFIVLRTYTNGWHVDIKQTFSSFQIIF